MLVPRKIQGHVVLSTGENPPEPVVVLLSCGSVTTTLRAFTNLEGRFEYAIAKAGRSGGNRSSSSKAGGATGVDVSGCMVSAEHAGYRSSASLLRRDTVSSADGSLAGAVVLHPIEGVQGNVVSPTSLSVSGGAIRAYRQGVRRLSQPRPNLEESIRHFERAISAAPQYAAAWTGLAEALLRVGDAPRVGMALRKAIEADPRYLRPYEALIRQAYAIGDWDTVAEYADEYQKLTPSMGFITYVGAVAAYRSNRYDIAERLARSFLEDGQGETYPETYVIVGQTLRQRGEYRQAAEMYRQYLKAAPEGHLVKRLQRDLYEWEVLQVIEPADASESTGVTSEVSAPAAVSSRTADP